LRTTSSSSPSNIGTDDDNNNDEERKETAASVLTPTRIQRLVDLGFVFATTEKNPYRKFSEWVQVLQAFKEGHGHCRVPLDYPPDPGLSAWGAPPTQRISEIPRTARTWRCHFGN
jgi:hypothetical protein